MRLRMICEKKDEFFTYVDLSKDMWRKKILDKQKEVNISFDLENNEDVSRRDIVIDQSFWDNTKCKFKCELRLAGGDWQCPVAFFCIQLVDGYAFGMSEYSNPYGVFIPDNKQGNPHLVKTEKGWTAPDADDGEADETKAWIALKSYLKELVEKEIDEVKQNRT